MTGPAWDGRGEDPWLPDRIRARSEILETERQIRNAFWAALSGWLVQLGRRVVRGDRMPDANAVWALVPAWREAVDRIVNGQIKEAMGLAYRRLLGDDFPWDQRSFVARHLTEVRNRMVRTPDEVYDVIAGQMSTGVNLGESVPKLAARVQETLSTTGTERWENRAVVVARTAAIGALNAGRADAFEAVAEEIGEPLEKVWLATDDARTRPEHALADGQSVPVGSSFIVGGFELDFPGDPTGPAHLTIQCRCSMLLVEPGEMVDLSNRQFRNR